MAWEEQWESREVTWDVDGSHAIRKWLVPWAERYTSPPCKIGTQYPLTEVDSGLLLYCAAVSVEPYARPGETGDAASHALVTATYKSLDQLTYNQGGNASPISNLPNMVEQLDIGGEMLNVDGGLNWGTDGASTTGQTINYMFPIGEYTITRSLTAFPSNLFGLMGCVNNSVFLPRGLSLPVGTVLFVGAKISQETQWAQLPYNGAVSSQRSWFRADFHFSINPRGWNYIWREDQKHWDYTSPLLYPFAYLGSLTA